MSRSGYVDDVCDETLANLYRGLVARTMRGKRSQAFLREMLAALDAMPEKALISDELVNSEGDCCAIGAVCLARGLDASKADPEEADQVAALVGISETLAREIEYENDEGGPWGRSETPQERWVRVRKWVESNIRGTQ